MFAFNPFHVVAGALLPMAAYAAIVSTDLLVTENNVAPDGFSRQAIFTEGQFPAPLIQGDKGDSFKINVIDRLSNNTLVTSTSIHWHGIFQHGTNWADGAAFVTQCPIVTGNSFLYDFKVPDQAGTYWYHSHLSTQYCDGLRGPLVIYDPLDPQKHLYDIDNEDTIITLADWYHTPTQLLAIPPAADSTLINGLGRYVGGPASPLAVITVEKGKRYRIRLISMSCDPNHIFSIDNHNMTIIEADGENTQPLLVDSLTIYAAQRYSFVLNANQPINNYWIRAQPNQAQLSGFANGLNSAILRYKGAPDVDPTTIQLVSVAPLLETNLHPLSNPAAPGRPYPGGADKVLTLALAFNSTDRSFTVNGTSFIPPDLPVLLQILSGAHDAQDLLPKGNVYGLPPKSVIEIVIPPATAPGGPHPFHLHGHTFSVVRSAGSSVYNYQNPVRRDVVSIGTATTDEVTIRFETNNPGPWFLHCHIDFHLVTGLAIVLAEDIQDTAIANPVPVSWSELCPLYYKQQG
ncbi:hypothetical protein EW026_g1911 [Hermanssonia centrifuga]|uniref:laccase n=1 Tax=Hermanssonia centrifuga TaxID=98765 RepID=A0A4S4KQS0_9APHY|nr:hypothetical protein EW026_g1911 [Hermanssonia centrifuga]